jgi:hypothetical protein
LLFAVVLAVAAIVSSIANPPERGGDDAAPATDAERTTPSPTATAPGGSTPQPKTIDFPAAAKPQTRTLEVGQPATLLVDVETPGQVDIPTLGLTDAAEPLTPALFEVLVTAEGKHPIVVQPAGSETLPSKVGTLEVVPRQLRSGQTRTVGPTAKDR